MELIQLGMFEEVAESELSYEDMVSLLSVSETSDNAGNAGPQTSNEGGDDSHSESASDASGSRYSFAAASSVFSSEQLAAAHAVLQAVQSDLSRHSHQPSPISIKGLLEVDGKRGWCLIGSCGRERARQRGRWISDYKSNFSMTFGELYVHICEHLIYGQPLSMRCKDW
jgi:hypothetical protein